MLNWITANPGSGLEPDDVPGASSEELARLSTLGRLCAQLLARHSGRASSGGANLTAIADGDERVLKWFESKSCPHAPPEVVEAAWRMLVAHTEDGLARLYSTLVSPHRRRRLGTFFTPYAEVWRMLTSWSEQFDDPATVVDVGAGVGIYTVASARMWPEGDVFAVDVNPVTLGLLAVRVSTHSAAQSAAHQSAGPGGSAGLPAEDTSARPDSESGAAELGNVHLVLDDYVGWASRDLRSLPSPRLILGNPPYTRMQLLPRDTREDLFARAGGMLGRRASLASLMTAVSLQLLEEDDGLCLLLPAQWLESDYAAGLREWLWRATHRRVELRLYSADLFKDAEVDAVSLLVGPERPLPQALACAVGTDGAMVETGRKGVSPAEWRSFFHDRPQPELGSRTTTNVDLLESRGLSGDGDSQVAPPPVLDLGTDRLALDGTTVLGDLARVNRGVATGANWFFVVSEQRRHELSLPDSVLRPLVRRLRPLAHLERRGLVNGSVGLVTDLDGRTTGVEMAWLLVTGPMPLDGVKEYLDSGGKAAQAWLCRQRDSRHNWFDLSAEARPVDVVVSPMCRGDESIFRLALAPQDSAILNNLYGLTWHETTTREVRDAVTGYLASHDGQAQLRTRARKQANGLLKIEPRSLASLPIRL